MSESRGKEAELRMIASKYQKREIDTERKLQMRSVVIVADRRSSLFHDSGTHAG